MRDIFGRGGDPYKNAPPEVKKERMRRLNEKTARKYFKKVKELPDDQEINVIETDHSSLYTQTYKISVGEFKKRLTDAVENDEEGVKVRFDDGKFVDFDSHDFYDIEVITPEVKAQEEEKEKNLKIIDGLEKEGVDTDIFFEFDQHGNRTIRYTPEQILEIGRKIEEYLQKTQEKNK